MQRAFYYPELGFTRNAPCKKIAIYWGFAPQRFVIPAKPGIQWFPSIANHSRRTALSYLVRNAAALQSTGTGKSDKEATGT